MKRLDKKLVLSILIFGMMIIYSFFAVAAGFGIIPPASSERPLILAPGEEKVVQLRLQNAFEEEDMIVRAELLEGEGIATLIDSDLDYILPLKEIVPVNIKLQIPETGISKGEHVIIFKLSDLTPSEEVGTVVIGTSSTTSFNVFVLEPGEKLPEEKLPEEKSPLEKILEEKKIWAWIILILVLIAAIVVIYLIIRRMKKRISQEDKYI